jgi:hypothetical protein
VLIAVKKISTRSRLYKKKAHFARKQCVCNGCAGGGKFGWVIHSLDGSSIV